MSDDRKKINQLLIGKKIVAASWLPTGEAKDVFSLESITLEGGLKLEIWASDYDNIVLAEIEERTMPTLFDRANKSYGITDSAGEMFFLKAHSLTIDDDGRLVFWRGFPKRVYAVVESGEWRRVLEGITLEEFKNGDTG